MINAEIFNFQTEGITRGSNLVFSNLINVNDLDFDFQIYLEVYGLQTPKERLSHEVSVNQARVAEYVQWCMIFLRENRLRKNFHQGYAFQQGGAMIFRGSL